MKIAERMFQSSSTFKRGASVTASQRPCSRQLPPERPAAAATTCTNGGGGPPHSPFSHLALPFLISPQPPAHWSSSQSLLSLPQSPLSSVHPPCSPQSPRPLPLQWCNGTAAALQRPNLLPDSPAAAKLAASNRRLRSALIPSSKKIVCQQR